MTEARRCCIIGSILSRHSRSSMMMIRSTLIAAALLLAPMPLLAAAPACSTTIEGCDQMTTTIRLAQLKAGESYVFFCSFPGHASMMKGTIKLLP
jgi:azurin